MGIKTDSPALQSEGLISNGANGGKSRFLLSLPHSGMSDERDSPTARLHAFVAS
jgi:hypothetical protein